MVRSDRHVHNLDRMAADRLPTAHAVETLAREVLAGKVVPRAAYRVQLHAGFTFDDARAVVPYLSDLGISHVYASPFLQANPGSTHGYDVVDYNRLNPEIGDESSLDALVSALREHGMGLVVDFVPNHMGIGRGANPWWQDVLENGLSSVYSAFFDIDWEPLKPELQGQVLLPVLGDQYGVVLERGELHLVYRAGEFAVHYFQLPLPISPPGYPLILADVVTRVAERLTPENHDLLELQSVTTAFERLPGNDDIEPEHLAERQREQVVAKRRLASLVDRVPVIAEAVAQVVDTLNGVPGDPHSFDALDQLLAAQSYRLAFWKVAAEEINYRRFFAINELAAIRQEVPAVFEATHQYLLRLAGDGKIDGIRLDHPDGLWDPGGYFRQLQSAAFLARARAALGEPKDDEWQPWCEALHDWWEREPRGTVVYSLAEKILEPGETLPRNWAIDGTVGYEFARVVTGLFVDPKARKPLDELNHRLSGEEIDFSTLVYESKQLIMRAALASEVNVLARVLDRITERRRRTRDFTVNSLRRVLREVIACFPIYRTYSSAADGNLTAEEQRAIETAVRAARRRSPESDPLVFDFLRDALLFRDFDGLDNVGREEQYRFVMKFQQLTGPVMAKGLEDTAFYRYVRLTSLNEVGGDPARFGTTVAEFHDSNLLRLRDWPHAMLASSTHDTKRSEDVRARIDAITELPRDWRVAVNRWTRLNRRHKRRVDGSPAPDRADEYLLYQTLIGMWPLDRVEPDADLTDRIDAYMAKSIHEAQRHTSWINPNADYDGATSAFVRAVLDRTVNAAFLDDLAGFRTRIDRIGLVNALAQQLLKLTAPGMPDLYQGTELWDFNLVDPDNRRPVDFPTHRRALSALRRRSPSVRLARELLAQAVDGRVKLWLTHRALMARRDHPDVFAGDYAALAASGAQAGHVIAFARHGAGREALVLVPRLVGSLPASAGGWPVGVLSRTVWWNALACCASMTRNGTESVRASEVIMRARLQLLQSWQRQVRALTVGVRVTQANALALLALGILLAGTVRLPQVARTVPGVAVDASVTRRLRRFLANPRVRVVDLWQPIRRVVLAGYAGRSLTLIFDPTPQAGQATVLMVAVIEHRRALPLIWQVVPQQQKWPDSLDGLLTPMLDQIAADLPPACTVTLVVDRGITGPTLIRRCQALGWHFTFRLSVGPNQTNRLRVDNRDVALWPWLQAHGFAWTGPVELFKEAGWLSLQLTVIWERGYDEPWVLLSDQPAGRTQVRIYRRRSRIEATFADTKRRGFELEQTKLVEFARIDRLLVALALALWWGTQAGLRMIRHGQRRRFDHPRRRDKSVIRLGREVFCDRLERDEQPPLPFRRHGATWCYAHYA